MFNFRKIKKLSDVEKSQSFCMLPWVHLYLNTQGKVTPCCISPWSEEIELGDINKKPLDSIWNDTPMKDLRKNMLRDRKNSGCWQCYLNEENGLKSKRLLSNQLYQHKFDWVKSTKNNGLSPDSKPIYWDIRISNLCNFKCRICGHHSSSKLYDEAKELGTLSFKDRVHYSINDLDDVLLQLEPHFSDLEEIYFAGGEPLIMPEHYRILNLLIKKGKKHIKLRYATNFSQYEFKGQSIFELWNQFEDVYVYASLDGSYERGEYQRKGQKWENVLENKKRLSEICPHVKFLITPTISVFNVQHLPSFHKEWVELGLIQADDMMPHVLKNPDIYDIRILPTEIKKQVESAYTDHLTWLKTFDGEGLLKLNMVKQEFESCIQYMWSEDRSELQEKFKENCDQLDQMRKETTLDIFPELITILKG
ncbi:MAG: twitch domain-containing radical SAM protein [Flavobacteriales bacterium]|nr:twitch domain-containing radical SAM protein [Flavobacteriales bacterium]